MRKKKHNLLKEYKIIYNNSVAEAKHTINQERDKITRFIKDKFSDVKQDLEDLAVYFNEKFNNSDHKNHSKSSHKTKLKK